MTFNLDQQAYSRNGTEKHDQLWCFVGLPAAINTCRFKLEETTAILNSENRISVFCFLFFFLVGGGALQMRRFILKKSW